MTSRTILSFLPLALLICCSRSREAPKTTSNAAGTRSVPQATADPAASCPPLWVHSGDHISALAFSPDSQWLATAADNRWVAVGSKPNHIAIWNSATGKLERTWDIGRPVVHLVFNPKGDTLASVDQKGQVEIWDFRKGFGLYRSQGGNLAYSPDGLIWAASKFVLDAQAPKQAQQCEQDCDGPPGNSIIEVHDAATGKLLRSIDAGLWTVITALSITPQGLIVAAGCEPGSEVCDGSAAAWDLGSGKLVKNYSHEADAFSPNGQLMASISQSGESGDIQVIDTWQDKVQARFKGKAAAFSSDWKQIAVTQGDTIELRSLVAETELIRVPGGGGPLAFSPDGKRLAAANYMPQTQTPIICDSRHTAIVTYHSLLRIWDVTTGREALTLDGPRPE